MVDDTPLSSFWPGPSPLVVVPNWDDNVYLNRHPSAAFFPHSTINPVYYVAQRSIFRPSSSTSSNTAMSHSLGSYALPGSSQKREYVARIFLAKLRRLWTSSLQSYGDPPLYHDTCNNNQGPGPDLGPTRSVHGQASQLLQYDGSNLSGCDTRIVTSIS